MKRLQISALMFCSGLIFQGCVSLKPHELIYVTDTDMQMKDDAGKNFRNYVSAIREGATPAGSPKASGGCGCN